MLATTILEGVKFPEGPRWHDGALWFSDIHGHRVYRMAENGDLSIVAELPDMPSGLGWLPDGTLLVVLMRSQRIVKVVDGKIALHADMSMHIGDHLNDMVVDSRGYAYAGSITYRGFSAQAMDGRTAQLRDHLVLVRPDGSTEVVADDVVGPNGTVISDDGTMLWLAETRALRITKFRVADDGSLHDRQVFADLDPLRADGIALDAEGALWCGLGECFGRVVQGGEIVERVEVAPGRNAVACALGGSDRRTLYMATNITSTETLARIHRVDGSYDDEAQSDACGWIEAVTVDVPGAGLP